MRTIRVFLASAALLFGLIPARSHAEFTPIDFPGAIGTQAQAINNRGDIVGQYTDAEGYHGFIFSAGTYRTIDVPGSTNTSIWSINEAGRLAGFYLSSEGVFGFVADGNNFTTVDVDGSDATYAYSVNDANAVVGMYAIGLANSGSHGYLLSEGVFTTLNAPGADFTWAMDINEAGQIAGSYGDSAGLHNYVKTGNDYAVISAPGTLSSEVIRTTRVNNKGHFLGNFYDSSGREQGYLQIDGLNAIISYPSAFETQANDLNDNGQVVGFYLDAAGNYHGYLLTVVPEPSSFILMAVATACAGAAYRLKTLRTAMMRERSRN